MKKTPLSLLLLMLLFAFSSCEPDFNQNADYKDVTIAYGFLNPQDSRHYLKVYKAFLTNDNAIVEAGKLDNITYYDSISVAIEEYQNPRQTNPSKVIPFTMTTAVPKDSGVFAYNPQVIYYSDAKLDQNAVYKLKIVNKFTQKTITAMTPLVKNFALHGSSIPYEEARFALGHAPVTVKFYTAENAVMYDFYLKFHYVEVDTLSGDTITPNGLVSWRMARLHHSGNNSYLETKLPLYRLYSVIGQNLKNRKEHVVRYIKGRKCVDLEIWAAEENYSTYLDHFQPSSSVVQDRADFTNMECMDGTAYGVFSSRNYAKRSYKIINVPAWALEDSLIYGSETKNLGFRKYVD